MQHRLHRAVDGNLLIIALPFADGGVGGRQKSVSRLVGYLLRSTEALPQFVWFRERVKFLLLTGCKVELDYAVAVR